MLQCLKFNHAFECLYNESLEIHGRYTLVYKPASLLILQQQWIFYKYKVANDKYKVLLYKYRVTLYNNNGVVLQIQSSNLQIPSFTLKIPSNPLQQQ